MSFFNPYMKKPDWGQGIGDMTNQFMMMYLLGMFDPKSKTAETTGITPTPQSRQMPQQVMQNMPGYQPPQGQAMGGVGYPANQPNIQQLLQILMSGGLGGMGGF